MNAVTIQELRTVSDRLIDIQYEIRELSKTKPTHLKEKLTRELSILRLKVEKRIAELEDEDDVLVSHMHDLHMKGKEK